MKTLSLLIITCLGSISHAADLIDYDGSIKFAQERSAEKVPTEKAIFCLGPDEVEEVYFNDGKEIKKIARFARSFDVERVKTLGSLFELINFDGGASYEIDVYRSDTKKVLVRVRGNSSELRNAQFGLRSGDLVLIKRLTKNKDAEQVVPPNGP